MRSALGICPAVRSQPTTEGRTDWQGSCSRERGTRAVGGEHRHYQRRDHEPVSQDREKIERLEPRLDAARAELYGAIRDAHAEGAGLATIARVAGYSREWVRRIVNEQWGYQQGYQSAAA